MQVHDRIGPYEIVREVGRGGMGVVYLAREPDEGTLIALKVLPESCTSDKHRLERFRREASTLMKVRHPNIVPIYSVGCADGTWFIAMKFIEGEPFDKLIDDRAATATSPPDGRGVVVPPADAPQAAANEDAPSPRGERIGPPISWTDESRLAGADPGDSAHGESLCSEDRLVQRSTEPEWVYRSVVIVERIARALDHLHSQGIVHRDIKPGNIIVDQSGEPWLVDFGLVRDLLARRGRRTEGIMGTFEYMAPEQAGRDRDRADGRCDLYALGVTLYEIATLRRPFDGDDTASILRAALKPPVRPRRLNPRVTRGFERVILKAMARNPDDRYQTGNALADDLERLRTQGKEPPPPPMMARFRRFGGKNPRLVAAIVLLVLMVVGLAGYCIEGELGERRRAASCREEADRAFARGDYGAAADGYRLYLSLGGCDSAIVGERLKICQDPAAPLRK